jgi:hypothetical protein
MVDIRLTTKSCGRGTRRRPFAGIFALLLLATPAVATDSKPSAKPQTAFLIQTGAFKSDEQAHQHCDPLSAAGFPLQVSKTNTGTSQRSVWFVCRSADAFERDHANEIIASLKSDAGVADAILLPVSLGAGKSTAARSQIPTELREQFEKFMGERGSQPVELFQEFMRRQAGRSN